MVSDYSRRRWEGESHVAEGHSGILFLSHPDNRDHPEPMRVWTSDSEDGRSNVFFVYTPTRHREWVLSPGKSYRLQYRMVIYDGTLDPEEAESYWKAFANKAPI